MLFTVLQTISLTSFILCYFIFFCFIMKKTNFDLILLEKWRRGGLIHLKRLERLICEGVGQLTLERLEMVVSGGVG